MVNVFYDFNSLKFVELFIYFQCPRIQRIMLVSWALGKEIVCSYCQTVFYVCPLDPVGWLCSEFLVSLLIFHPVALSFAESGVVKSTTLITDYLFLLFFLSSFAPCIIRLCCLVHAHLRFLCPPDGLILLSLYIVLFVQEFSLF